LLLQLLQFVAGAPTAAANSWTRDELQQQLQQEAAATAATVLGLKIK
jgi:hypothetical protein